jgi:hypothetical protein
MGFKLFGTEGGVQPRGFDEVEAVEDPTPEALEIMQRLQRPAFGELVDELLDPDTTFDEANVVLDKIVSVKKAAPRKRPARPKPEISTEATVTE